MRNRDIQNLEEGIALSQQFAKQQVQSTFAMVVSAVVAFWATSVIAPGVSGLGLAVAAATGLTVGVWCQPNSYRRRNGSLSLAIVLVVGMWAVPVIVMLTSFLG